MRLGTECPSADVNVLCWSAVEDMETGFAAEVFRGYLENGTLFFGFSFVRKVCYTRVAVYSVSWADPYGSPPTRGPNMGLFRNSRVCLSIWFIFMVPRLNGLRIIVSVSFLR